jgi:predicted Zn-dependent protease
LISVRKLLLSCLAAACSIASAQSPDGNGANDLPDIGTPSDVVISKGDEYSLGRMVVRSLRDQGQLFEDPEVADYVQSLGQRIGVQATDGSQRFTFFVVRDPSINAFALPGGFIGVNEGLVLATANEAQLAGVLAHEIAHVTQRHLARQARAQSRQGLATAATMIAAILIGAATGSADAVPAGIAIAQGGAAQSQLNYTRANEYEADRVGIGILASAGFDPNGMADFFETLGRRSGLTAGLVPELLQSHPISTNRIAEARDRSRQMTVRVRPESDSYAFIRERIRVVSAPADADLRPYYRERASINDLSRGQLYGLALAETRAGNPAAAIPLLKELSASRQDLPFLQTALAEAQTRAGDKIAAVDTLERALKVSPRNVPLTVRYAELLLAEGRARLAHQVLLDVFNIVPPTQAQIKLTALAASSAGDAGDAYYYMSEYHIAGGDLPMAAEQLELALAARDITPIQRQKYAARLKEIRDFLAENASKRRRNREQQRPDPSARISP